MSDAGAKRIVAAHRAHGAHFAVWGLMHEAVLKADGDPDRLPFSHAVRVVRRKAPAGFPATVCVAGQPGDFANDIRALDL